MSNKIVKFSKNTAASLFLALSSLNLAHASSSVGSGGTSSTSSTSGAGDPLGPYAEGNLGSFRDLLDKQLLPFIFGAAGVIFVVLFIVGGVQYLTSAGNEDASTKAKKLLMDAVIGIVIVVAAWAISSWILTGIGGQANFGE